MQVETTGATQRRGLFDFLDTAAEFAIRERFGESGRENDSDGTVTELANPQTVTQPVNPSQFPSGQPNPPGGVSIALNSQQILLLGVAGLLVVVLFMVRR